MHHPNRFVRLAALLFIASTAFACDRPHGETPARLEAGPARLVELWRAGGLNEGEELAYPVGLAASADGRVAIPDFQLAEVPVIERDGRWLGSWTRRGPGPGELTSPVAASWSRDGRLAVFDISASKVLFLDDGEPAGDDIPVAPSFTAPVVASGQVPWAGVQPNGGALLQPVARSIPGSGDPGLRSTLLLFLPPGASVADTLARATVRTVPDGPFAGWALPGWPRLLAAVGSDGAIAVAAAESAYRITVYDSAGAPVRRIVRDAPPLPVTPRERGDGAVLPPALAEALRHAPLPGSPQPFGRLFWGARGRLWVQRERPSPVDDADVRFGVPGAHYDVFDSGGRYLGEVRAPERARLQAAAGDTVWGVEVGSLDEVSVVAYRVARE